MSLPTSGAPVANTSGGTTPYQAPVIAPLNTWQERSIAAPELLAQIITAKYCDHLPLHPQERIYAMRHGGGGAAAKPVPEVEAGGGVVAARV